MPTNETLGTGEKITTTLKRVIYQCEVCGGDLDIEDDKLDYSFKNESGKVRIWHPEHYDGKESKPIFFK